MSLEQAFAEALEFEKEEEASSERAAVEAMEEAAIGGNDQTLEATVDQMVRQVVAGIFYEIAEYIMKPETAGVDFLKMPMAERKIFSEYEQVLFKLKSHYGRDIFKPMDPECNAYKVAKVARKKLQMYLKRADGEGKAICVDADGMRCEWRMV